MKHAVAALHYGLSDWGGRSAAHGGELLGEVVAGEVVFLLG